MLQSRPFYALLLDQDRRCFSRRRRSEPNLQNQLLAPYAAMDSNRMPVWVTGLVGFFETYGWTLIVAMILAGVWQIAEKH